MVKRFQPGSKKFTAEEPSLVWHHDSGPKDDYEITDLEKELAKAKELKEVEKVKMFRWQIQLILNQRKISPFRPLEKLILVYVSLKNHQDENGDENGGTLVCLGKEKYWQIAVKQGQGIEFDNMHLCHAIPLIRQKDNENPVLRALLRIQIPTSKEQYLNPRNYVICQAKAKKQDYGTDAQEPIPWDSLLPLPKPEPHEADT